MKDNNLTEKERIKKKKDRDTTNASILSLITVSVFEFFFLTDRIWWALATLGVFALILYMDRQKEKVEERLERLSKAYDEQILRPSVNKCDLKSSEEEHYPHRAITIQVNKNTRDSKAG